MTLRSFATTLSLVAVAACAPAPNAVTATSGEGTTTSCTMEAFCSGQPCEGVSRAFRCDQNGDTYDCVCVTDGEDGAAFTLDDACVTEVDNNVTVFTISIATIVENLNAECDAALVVLE